MSETNRAPREIGRRGLLGVAGASIAAAAIPAASGHAAAAAGAVPTQVAGGGFQSLGTDLPAGQEAVVIDMFQFRAIDGFGEYRLARDKGVWALPPAGGPFPGGNPVLRAPLAVPFGSIIRNVEFYGFMPNAAGYPTGSNPKPRGGVRFVDFENPSGDTDLSTGDLKPAAEGSNLLFVSFRPETGAADTLLRIAPGVSYRLTFENGSEAFQLLGARIAYTPPSAGYVTIPSTRVLDTRPGPNQTGYTGAKPKIGDVIFVNVPSVPSEAKAIVATLTISETVGGGFVTAFDSALATAPDTSNINWTGTIDAGTTVIVNKTFGANGLKLAVGGFPGATTHIIVDVVGFFL